MKKKIISSVILAVMLITYIVMPVSSKVMLYGDVDYNGAITAADARLALRCSVNLVELSDEQKKAGDMDKDDQITAADARTILRLSVGLFEPANIIIEKYDENKDYSQYNVITCAHPFYYIVLRTDKRVTDVKFYGLEDKPDLYEFTFTELSACDEITPEKPVVVQLPFSYTYVTHGISYKEADGKEKFCAFVYDEATGRDTLKLLKPVPKQAEITARAGQFGMSYADSKKVYADISSSCTPVIVTTSARISDFKVYSLRHDYYSYYEPTLIENCGVVEAGASVVIYLKLRNSSECQYGFSYTDADGTKKVYGIGYFGNNGNINLKSINIFAEKTPTRATISGEFAKRVYYDYSGFDTINADTTQYRWAVILKTDVTIKNVKVHYGYLDSYNGYLAFNVTRSYNYGTLEPDTPLLIYISQPGDFPSYAFSYTDADGRTRAFIFDESYSYSGDPKPSPVPMKGGEMDYCLIRF